jgi:uncharacterized protein (UPF0333 family)
MINKKGQGALEYLLILAAVLAIAVVVILVAHQIATPAQNSAVVNQDKYNCAQAGIELVNYNALPHKYSNVNVSYQGKEVACEGLSEEIDKSDLSKVNAACTIHDDNGREHNLGVVVNGTDVQCYIGDWAGDIDDPGNNDEE